MGEKKKGPKDQKSDPDKTAEFFDPGKTIKIKLCGKISPDGPKAQWEMCNFPEGHEGPCASGRR